jgi:hypothetical protein
MPKPSSDDTYSEAETVARREAALKRAFSMPHKPQEPIGKGRRESQSK